MDYRTFTAIKFSFLKNRSLYLFLFIALPWFAAYSSAQRDSLPSVWTVLPKQYGAQRPFISPFCKDKVWFRDHVYDLPGRRYLLPDDTLSCFPAAAVRIMSGSDPDYPFYLWWRPDPYTDQYYWTDEYRNDTLFIWRYNVRLARQDCFFKQYQANESLIGKAGIWISHNQELVLVDRHSGQVLLREGTPDSTARYSLGLRNWGENIMLNDQRIYQYAERRYVPFFPLPADMEGCKYPGGKQFDTEVCGSWYAEDANNQYAYFLSTPSHPPVRLPFKLAANGASIEHQILASNPPLTWFYFPDKLIAYNIYTGDSVVYAGSTGEPLPGDQNGRFLGFRSELGLSFFDKDQCQFRRLDLPYGFEWPRHFTCNQDYIFITCENYWRIIDCSKLDTIFQRSLVEEEYQVFKRELAHFRKDASEDFYAQYAAYLKLYDRYRDNKNPKIAQFWDYAKYGISQALYAAPDSLLEKIAVEYEAGKYDPSISCELATTLFNYYGYYGELQKARYLLSVDDNAACIEEKSGSGTYYIDLIKTTQFRLDSVQKSKQPKDQLLYAMGKIWWDYCYQTRGFRYSLNPRGDFEQSYNYYRKLIQQYPKSKWADNAAYDTMYYIDYHGTTTDDETPDGNDAQAYEVFTQFLKDYPHSDRRPNVLLRLAAIVQRGLQGRYNNQSGQEQLADYLETIANEYPDFAKTTPDYQIISAGLKRQSWASRWKLLVSTDQKVYKLSDTIRVTIQLYNQSGKEQTLDTAFLNTWQRGLYLHLNQQREQGCEPRSGGFPLLPEKRPIGIHPVTVAPGTDYKATFVLAHTSQIRMFGFSIFDLASGGNYSYGLQYCHPVLTWLFMSAIQGGDFRVE